MRTILPLLALGVLCALPAVAAPPHKAGPARKPAHRAARPARKPHAPNSAVFAIPYSGIPPVGMPPAGRGGAAGGSKKPPQAARPRRGDTFGFVSPNPARDGRVIRLRRVPATPGHPAPARRPAR